MVFDLNNPGVKEALFYERIDGNRVRCNLCYKRCIVVDGAFGACGVRANRGGKLYSLVYGLLTASNPDPIEKKPLMHFNPGSCVFSISTVGCNFYCRFCQNWVISQSRRDSLYGEPFEPEEVIDEAIKSGCQGLSYTYNEPTVFYEFMLDTAKLAKSRGLFNTMVTNGYMTPEAVDTLAKYIDAATVDFKGSGNRDFYRSFMGVLDPEPTYQTILEMKRHDWWIEVTNLIIPYYGDKLEDFVKLAKWIVENLGEETPVHLLRFYPQYMMEDIPPTPVETLERFAKIGFELGLKHIYIGNVGGHELENTYCPSCGRLVVKRMGFYVIEWRLKEDYICPYCGKKLNFRGKYWSRKRASLYW